MSDASADMNIALPLSKSMAARLLILDYVNGVDVDRVLPDCDDSRELSKALRRLRENPRGEFNLGTGATSLRFFTALGCALPEFEGTVDCSDQLRRRPLAPLIEALRSIGADIRCMDKEGCAPLYVKGKKLKGDAVDIDGSVSSQFISALMMISPLCATPIDFNFQGAVVSQPYIEMTRKLIDNYSPGMQIEADWSAAAFCYEYALVFPELRIKIKSLTEPEKSVQGDAGCMAVYDAIGIHTVFNPDGSASLVRDEARVSLLRGNEAPLELDLGDMPDLVPSLAVALTLADIPFRIHNITHLQYKESNRLEAIIVNLAHLGYKLQTDGRSLWSIRNEELGIRNEELGMRNEELGIRNEELGIRNEGLGMRNEELGIRNEGLGIRNEELGIRNGIEIDSYDDHRIAMAFAPALRLFPGVSISNPGCVSKSFPSFWSQFKIQEI